MEIRIFVVDDDLMSLKLTRRVFDKAGIEGQYFSSGKDMLVGLDRECLPDLFMLDVHMPDINGLDLFSQIRKDPALRNIPVIFLTGDEDIKTETAGLNAVDLYLISEFWIRISSHVLSS